jgi:L-lactate dehydrogenase (cytochrome)
VAHLLDLFEKEMKVAMTLTGARTIADLNSESLVSEAMSTLNHSA